MLLVDAWLTLSNTLHGPYHSCHNNVGRGTCSTPNGCAEFWSLSFVKYPSDAQGKSTGSGCHFGWVVTDS